MNKRESNCAVDRGLNEKFWFQTHYLLTVFSFLSSSDKGLATVNVNFIPQILDSNPVIKCTVNLAKVEES